jgi:hypothetical protein
MLAGDRTARALEQQGLRLERGLFGGINVPVTARLVEELRVRGK